MKAISLGADEDGQGSSLKGLQLWKFLQTHLGDARKDAVTTLTVSTQAKTGRCVLTRAPSSRLAMEVKTLQEVLRFYSRA